MTTPPATVLFEDLASRIRDDLKRHCPALSLEQRTIYAVQIALAEFNAAAGRPVDSLELCTLGVTVNATN